MVNRFLFFCFVTLTTYHLHAQDVNEGLVAHYSFDACDNPGVDESGNNSAAVIQGNPECVCGVSGNALLLDGVDDYLLFLGTISNSFNTVDFTVSLYIKPNGGGGIQDVISKKEACDRNRAFSISYVPNSNTLRTQLSQDEDRFTNMDAALDFSNCWYHLVYIRRGNRSQFFIDGELVREQVADSRVQIDNNAELNIANGECVGITENRFSGIVDELRVYNRALRVEEIQTLYLRPDKIENDDEVVFLGNAVDITVGETCADAFAWNPTAGVLNPAAAETSTVSPACGLPSCSRPK